MRNWILLISLASIVWAELIGGELDMKQMRSCFAKPEACFQSFCLLVYGWNEYKETVWQFLDRKTSGCEDILKPLAEKPPASDFYLTEDNGVRMLLCIRSIQNVADPGVKAVVDEFRSRSEKQRARKRREKWEKRQALKHDML